MYMGNKNDDTIMRDVDYGLHPFISFYLPFNKILERGGEVEDLASTHTQLSPEDQLNLLDIIARCRFINDTTLPPTYKLVVTNEEIGGNENDKRMVPKGNI